LAAERRKGHPSMSSQLSDDVKERAKVKGAGGGRERLLPAIVTTINVIFAPER
jgi:hypothetical protein